PERWGGALAGRGRGFGGAPAHSGAARGRVPGAGRGNGAEWRAAGPARHLAERRPSGPSPERSDVPAWPPAPGAGAGTGTAAGRALAGPASGRPDVWTGRRPPPFGGCLAAWDRAGAGPAAARGDRGGDPPADGRAEDRAPQRRLARPAHATRRD